MPDAEIVQKISKISEKGEEETKTFKRTIPNQDHFESLMQQSADVNKIKVQETNAQEAAKKTTLMDEVRNANHSTVYPPATQESLIAQTQAVVKQIESIKQTLAAPNVELKDSVQTLLKQKLEHVDENIKIALEKVGSTEYKAPEQLSSLGKPLERFIGFLAHSQYNLEHIGDDVQKMALDGTSLTPASMLAIQIKVSYVQQELEFFTSMLSKALESTKTIMNVQV